MGCFGMRYIAIKLHRKWKRYPPGPGMVRLCVLRGSVHCFLLQNGYSVGLPLVGSALPFLGFPYRTLDALGSYGKATTVQLGLNTNIFLNDMGLAKKVMKDDHVGSVRPPIANLPHLVHFLALNGDPWKQRRKYFSSQLVPMLSDSQFLYNTISQTIDGDIAEDLDRIEKEDGLWFPAEHCSFIDLNLMFHGIFGVALSLNHDETGYVSKLLPVPSMWFQSVTRVLILAASVSFKVGSFAANLFTNGHNKLEQAAATVLVQWMKEYGGFEFNAEQKTLSRRFNKV